MQYLSKILLMGCLAFVNDFVSAQALQVPSQEVQSPSEETDLSQFVNGATYNLEYRNPYLEHASLAAFSVGSLVVGGVFYALQTSVASPNVGFVRNDRSTLGTAVGAASITAVVAGISYFFYSARDVRRARAWDARVSGDLDPERGVNVSAALSFPLPLP